MTVTTLSNLEFDEDVGRARDAAAKGPVVITDRGVPAHVLLSIEDYRRLSGQNRNIADLLAMPEDVALDLRRRDGGRPAPEPVARPSVSGSLS